MRMIGRRFSLDAFSELQTRCHIAGNAEDVNEFLRSDQSVALLSFLGIHVGIFGYVHPMENDSPLFYLTNDEDGEDERTFRRIRWPFLVDTLDGRWRFERHVIERLRLGWATQIRLAEYSSSATSQSRTLETLAALDRKADILRKDLCSIEVDGRLLYAPMGEILASLLGWHLECLFSSQEGFTIAKLHEPLVATERLDESPTAKIFAHLRVDSEHFNSLPTMALLSMRHHGKRDLSWLDILIDLGLLGQGKDRRLIFNNARLRPLVLWILSQVDEGNSLRSPRAVIEISRKEKQTLVSYLENPGPQASQEAFITVCSVLIAAHGGNHAGWEKNTRFGLANHLVWMSAGKPARERWLSAYDWVCFQVIPGLEDRRDSQILTAEHDYLPRGVAFLTLRSNEGLWANPNRLRRRLALVRAITLALATAENRFTYYSVISQIARELLDANKRNVLSSLEAEERSFNFA